MKNFPLAYFFPAKIVFADYGETFEAIPCPYAQLGKLPGNVYFDTKKGRIVTEGKAESFSVFALVNGAWIFLRNFSADFNLAPWIERVADTLPAMLRENAQYVENPFLYEQAQTAKREASRLANQERDARIQEQKEQAAQRERERFAQAAQSFASGEPIAWDDFESACKNRGIRIPIGTIGWGRKNVSTIRRGGYSLARGNKSSVIFDYINMLSEMLSPVTA